MTAVVQFRFHKQSADQVELFLQELCRDHELLIEDPAHAQRIFLDSFDWRLARCEQILELIPQDEGHWRLELLDRKTGQLILAQQVPLRPKGIDELPAGAMRELLAPVGIRSLLCEAYVDAHYRLAHMRNKEGKTVLRLEAGHYRAHNGTAGNSTDLGYWLLLRPVRGYDKAMSKLARRLAGDPRLEPAEQDFFEAATLALGNRPLDYSPKLDVPLEPDMPAWAAMQRLLHCLLHNMLNNESGTCADRDPEFLHDFRVAVRRSRVLLSDMHGVIPRQRLRPFRQELRWLQQVTGRARDLDVYLLGLPDYRSQLDPAAGEALAPLEKFLRAEKRNVHLELARELRGQRYIDFKREWSAFINHLGDEPGDKNFSTPVLGLAGRFIRKSHKRVLKSGSAIDDESPPEALHDLRKLCKHLRYMLEFFQRLYPEQDVPGLIKDLKGLQDILGDFQDYEVQAQTLAEFENELLGRGLAGADTAEAIEQLIAGLDKRKEQTRGRFAASFAAFSAKDVRAHFTALYGKSGRKT